MRTPFLFVAFVSFLIVGSAAGEEGCGPRPLGSIGLLFPSSAVDMAVDDDVAYVAAIDSLKVIDISDPLHPTMITSLAGTHMSGIAIDGSVAYIFDALEDQSFQRVLRTIDISDPANPVFLGTLTLPRRVFDITAEDGVVYIAAGRDGLLVIDASDPRAPTIATTLITPDFPLLSVTVEDNILYTGGPGTSILQIIDVAHPFSPVLLSEVTAPGSFGVGGTGQIAIADGVAYLTRGFGGFLAVDVSDPADPVILTGFEGFGLGFPSSVAVSDDVAYVLQFRRVLNIDVSDPAHATIIGALPTRGAFGQITVSDDVAIVRDPDFGLRLFDVSVPRTPPVLSTLPVFGTNISISGPLAFVTTQASHPDRGSLLNIDIADPSAPAILGSVEMPGRAHAVAIAERPAPVSSSIHAQNAVSMGDRIAFVAAGVAGLQVVDVSDPAHPSIISSVDTPKPATGVALAGDVALVTIAGGAGGPGVAVVDVSDAAHPFLILVIDTPGHAESITVLGGLCLVADFNDLVVFDVTDPRDPVLLSVVDVFTADVAVSGDLAYVASYQDGLQIIDISDPASPFVVGSIDTPGGADSVAVSGDTAFVVGGFGWTIVNVADPSRPVILTSVLTSGVSIEAVGDVVYTSGSFQVTDVSSCLGESCPGDLDDDGDSDGADLMRLLNQFGGPGSADLDGDGIVDSMDLAHLLNAWGPCS